MVRGLEADSPLPKLLRDRAADHPDTPFLADVDGDQVTYGEGWARVTRAAAELQAAGVAVGDPVAVLLDSSVDSVVSWLALATLGAIEVPVNLAYHGDMLAQVLDDAGARAAVVGANHLASLVGIADRVESLGPIVVLGAGQEAVTVAGSVLSGLMPVQKLGVSEGPRSEGVTDTLERSSLACLLHTSGTTGRSKGVKVPWAQLSATALNLFPEPLTEHDITYVPAPMFHVGGKAPVQLVALAGASGVLRPAFKTGEFWPEVVRFGCTHTFLGAAMANFLLDDPNDVPARHQLRRVLVAPAIARVAEFRERFGVQVSSAYNMTELSCPLTTGWIDEWDGSCGSVRSGVECRLVDEHDRPVAEGVVGELLVRSLDPWTISSGYWRRPEATVEAWRNLWFHTGDAFRREGDRFTFVDRLTDSIRRRGENISSMELEDLLLRHAAVVEVAVVGVPSQHGEDEVMVWARLTPEALVTPEELHAAWLEWVPRFMVPSLIEIVPNLPRTPNEKVRKADLRARGVGPGTWRAPDPRAGS